MKKFIVIILSLLLVISVTALIGYDILMASDEVIYKDDVLSLQSDYEEYFMSYGYSLDNPNIVVNPYKISPLTALVMFELDEVNDIEVFIYDKNDNESFNYVIAGSKSNYVPIYGLYSDYNNKVMIKCGGENKVINIKTERIKEFLIIDNYKDKDITFVDMDSYSYAVDKNGDIRWYIDGFGGKLDTLSNGHFFLHTDRSIGNGYYTGVVEMDALGKIYYEYDIDNGGYKGSYSIVDENNLYIASLGYVNLLNVQSGGIVKYASIDILCNDIDFYDNKVWCSNNEGTYLVDMDTGNVSETDKEDDYSNLYVIDMGSLNNYRLVKGIKFDNYSMTDTVNKRIFLFGYADMDLNKFDVDIYQETNRLVVKANFSSNGVIYVILDGINGKKIYMMDSDNDSNYYYKYINNIGLDGKYTIYFDVDGNLYKTKYYVRW
jgi:hypothetical protein